VPGNAPGGSRDVLDVPGRYERDRSDMGEGYTDQAPEPYDPPRRQFDESVPRYASPSYARHDIHMGE
jgi:hypothetical protein